MEAVYAVIGGLAGLGVSTWAGLRLGRLCRERPVWVYWALNAAAVLLGIALCALGAQYQLTWLWVAGLGVMGGGLTGLKYGLGRSVGASKPRDRATGPFGRGRGGNDE